MLLEPKKGMFLTFDYESDDNEESVDAKQKFKADVVCFSVLDTIIFSPFFIMSKCTQLGAYLTRRCRCCKRYKCFVYLFKNRLQPL